MRYTSAQYAEALYEIFEHEHLAHARRVAHTDDDARGEIKTDKNKDGGADIDINIARERKSGDQITLEYRKVLTRFIETLQKNGDSALLHAILARYERKYLAKKGLKKVEVETTAPLTPELRKNIAKLAGPARKVYLIEKVNPEILAGMTILINDTVLIDASGRTRIRQMFT